MNTIHISTCSTARLSEAVAAIENKSLLFDKDSNILYVKYDDSLQPLGNSNGLHFDGNITTEITALPTSGYTNGSVIRLAVQSTINNVLYGVDSYFIYLDFSGTLTWYVLEKSLVFDSTPTKSSVNPVTSGGVFSAILAETTARQNADNTLTANLANEVTNRINADNTLTANLANEVTNRINADNTLTANLAAETTRATKAESANATAISTETTRAKAAESTLTTNLAAETTRATTAESANASDLSDHISDTSNPHNVNKTQIGLGNVTNLAAAGYFTKFSQAQATSTYGVTITAAIGGTEKTITLGDMTSSSFGLGKLGSDTTQTVTANTVTSTTGRTYAVQENSNNQLVVNVPWTDTNTTYSAGANVSIANNVISATNTTYSAGTGISLSGTVINCTVSTSGFVDKSSAQTISGNKTFSGTETFSGTLIIPTTSSSTIGALWIS